ncbi:NAD(P)-dependent alcohol dehydrogenase [Xylanimonas allomyrinae]|uniref:NAD(P)-dependent alcohol dehydrogenase n=1 Tax=Xylanimonas allomyrinae TaxID=2509459 RepID=UPI001B85FE7B|nr:NAD(P)-dependent alcohol dehydrogenase [Xylanimonas allomyrinae]
MRTLAAVATAPKTDLSVTELELDECRPDELRVRMVASGVCHTDAIVRDQWYPTPLPAVLGHEGSGVVEAVGADVTGFSPGDRVVLAPASCGACTQCIAGHPQYCEQFYAYNFGGSRPDGSTQFTDDGVAVSSNFFGQSSFSQYVNVKARNAVTVSDTVPLELLGPLGCGIMTGAGSVLNVLRPGAGDSIAIFGTGAVGMAAMLAAVAAGATTVVMVDIVQSRLDLALQLGATHVVNSTEADPVERIKEITGGGARYALDTTGVPAVFAQMTRSLALLGVGGLVGAAPLGTDAPFDIGTLLTSGITIKMIVEGDSIPREFIPRLISLYEAGKFPFDKLVTTYEFADINRAFADSESGATIKPVLLFPRA